MIVDNSKRNFGGAKLIAAALCLVAAAAALQVRAAVDEKDPASLVAGLERELSELEAGFERTIKERYPGWLAAAEQLSARRPQDKDGLVLKQMANLLVKVEQVKHAVRRFGLQVAKQIIEEQFLQQQGEGAVRADLKLQPKHGQVLVERAKLRSLVYAYRFGDIEWRELYKLIESFVPADQASMYPEAHQLAKEAHAERFAHQKLAKEAYSRQKALLEEGDEGAPEVVLAHVDNVLDGAAKCEKCRQVEEESVFNFFTYPLLSEQGVREQLSPIEGLESSCEEGRAALPAQISDPAELAKVDEENIGFQGFDFLGESVIEQYNNNNNNYN